MPKAALIFWTFRIVVATGVAMMAVGPWAGVARWLGSLCGAPWLRCAAPPMGPSGHSAAHCGWIAT